MCGTIFPLALCAFAWGLACLQLHESQAPPMRLVSTAAMVSCIENHGVSCVWDLATSPLYTHQKASKANALAKHYSPCRSEHQVNTVLCFNYGRYVTAQMLPKKLRFGSWAWVTVLWFSVLLLWKKEMSENSSRPPVHNACESSSGYGQQSHKRVRG